MSLKEQLKNSIRSHGEIGISVLEDTTKKLGFKISNYERRCRELTNEGLIKPIRNDKGYIAGYKWIGERDVVTYLNEGIEKNNQQVMF